ASMMIALAAICGLAWPAAGQVTPPSMITTASGVRVRASAQVSAEELIKLPIGTVLDVGERSAGKEAIGGASDYWYRVSLPDGRQGWIFGAFLTAFDAGKRAQIYLAIASDRLKNTKTTFADQAELTRFLERAITEVSEPNGLAELELARL